MRGRFSLRTKVIAISILFLGILMGIFLYVHQLDRKDQLNNTNADRNQQVDQYLEKRQLMMRNTLSVIAADSSWSELIFADDSYLKNVAINKQSEHLRVLRQHIPETDMVSFVDHINGGVELLRMEFGEVVPQSKLSTNEKSQTYYLPALKLNQGEMFQSKPYLSDVSRRWVISSAVPVFKSGTMKGESNILGFIHLETNIQAISLDLQEINAPDTNIYITTENGNVIATNNQAISDTIQATTAQVAGSTEQFQKLKKSIELPQIPFDVKGNIISFEELKKNLSIPVDVSFEGNQYLGVANSHRWNSSQKVLVITTLKFDPFAFMISRFTMMVSIILLLLVIALVTLSFWIHRTISVPMKAMMTQAKWISQGKLSMVRQISVSNNEIGQLTKAFSQMVDGLRDIVSRIIMSANSLSTSTQEISASTEQIASQSEESSMMVKRLHAIAEEIRNRMMDVTGKSSAASHVSGEMRKDIEDGDHVLHVSQESMDELKKKMKRLEDGSKQIGDIIEVIDEITEQTHMLALNAAIEAGRAGEHGRGFSIVAEEVRKLAERSVEATNQITMIILSMQDQMRSSSKAVSTVLSHHKDVSNVFARLVTKINQSAEQITNIYNNSREQQVSTYDLVNLVNTMARGTTEMASASGEIAGSLQFLMQLSEELSKSVQQFQVYHDQDKR